MAARDPRTHTFASQLDELADLVVVIELEDGATPALRKRANHLAETIASEVGTRAEIVLDQAAETARKRRKL
jgi:hypothetical protein